MSEKIYQINSNQIGVVNFDKPWFLCHFEIEGEKPVQVFFPTLELGVKKIALFFEETVISKWLKLGPMGIEKIERLRKYLLTTWFNPGVETMREAMYEQYGFPEFRDKTGEQLIYDGYNFMAVVIGHIALRFNKLHFYFEGFHFSGRVVDKFLAINFWDKVKQDALNKK